MTIKALKPFVPAGKDFELSKSFFADLGFSTNWSNDGYCEFQWGDGVFILQNHHDQHVQENLMIQVEVQDLDAFWNHVQSSSVIEKYSIRAKEPQTYPWGNREVHLIDPAGVCWHFLQS